MELGEIISDAATYPSSNWTKVIILGILFILSFLIIPAFLMMGYMLRILKASIAGVTELPEFDEWSEMFIDGLKVFVVEIVYFIIPVAIIIGGSWASMMSMQNVGAMVSPAAAIGLMGGVALIGILLILIIGLIVIMALANMAYYDGDLGAAFRFSEILDIIAKIGWGNYIVWYIVMIIIGVVVGIVASVLGIIPILGWIILALIVYPYFSMFVARSAALIYTAGR